MCSGYKSNTGHFAASSSKLALLFTANARFCVIREFGLLRDQKNVALRKPPIIRVWEETQQEKLLDSHQSVMFVHSPLPQPTKHAQIKALIWTVSYGRAHFMISIPTSLQVERHCLFWELIYCAPGLGVPNYARRSLTERNSDGDGRWIDECV